MGNESGAGRMRGGDREWERETSMAIQPCATVIWTHYQSRVTGQSRPDLISTHYPSGSGECGTRDQENSEQ